ncbi:hypothetical protein BV898_05589 [Hypsibius exemplaris]|uniref:Uncharacterized protein n=1 Tax=Hypsibius exemplaris TaxID=2072580 RepID=A0A1W0WYM0_HYPEX|nr:hypothetical protein BV898_05589 [Hypsibius exemplaris]
MRCGPSTFGRRSAFRRYVHPPDGKEPADSASPVRSNGGRFVADRGGSSGEIAVCRNRDGLSERWTVLLTMDGSSRTVNSLSEWWTVYP